MTNEPHDNQRQRPVKKIITGAGIFLILLGYRLLAIQPETEATVAIKHAFLGIIAIIVGATLCFSAIFLNK
ncbi:MAG: hypothetical protein A2505_06450 [Deltaproteobacteria bacterium RIFOXYD12_FULL_55_16]|nr:MAG: hypothetical protein A2505_06450 [Deltaproteobacteria bacterium RIFOXYD12_FULL_55_16]